MVHALAVIRNGRNLHANVRVDILATGVSMGHGWRGKLGGNAVAATPDVLIAALLMAVNALYQLKAICAVVRMFIGNRVHGWRGRPGGHAVTA